MKIQDFAKKIGIGNATMSKILGGKDTSTATIKRIAEALEMDPAKVAFMLLSEPRDIRAAIKKL